jgi:hypothetical protein
MFSDSGWAELQRQRFPDLPFDCGNRDDPGIIYSEDLRDWSDKATTPDQARIERYIDRFDLRDKRLLHIGIGNSGLARRMHDRLKEIVGTTIDQPEFDVARSLSLPNYSYVLHNKYSGQHDTVPGTFDLIIDNNPTSPCCCIRHLALFFDFLDAKLSPTGQIVTDQEGLAWVPDQSHPQWSFSFDDLRSAANVAGSSVHRTGRTVYVISRGPPWVPDTGSLLRLHVRQVRSVPRRLASLALSRARTLQRLFWDVRS